MKYLTLLLLLHYFTAGLCLAQESNAIDYRNLIRNSENQDFAKVTAPRDFVFPHDHGEHPDYKIEWWYLTGHLHNINDASQKWGYQITFFRFALSPDVTPEDQHKDWQSNQVYAAHFALTDINNNKHFQFERFSRPALGLAGVTNQPLTVWQDNWVLSSENSKDLFPAKLYAQDTDADYGTVAIDFNLINSKPIVLQGDRGFSKKSNTQGNASYYYSYTRIATDGSIIIGDNRFQVSGDSWLDREWGSSSLDTNQVGWDWFALQLENNQELMYYRLRSDNEIHNRQHESSQGLWVFNDGTSQRLFPQDVNVAPLEFWQSNTGQKFPIKWQIKIPSLNVDITVDAEIKDQLWKKRLKYWEGAMIVTGSHKGRGYLELSGY